eukprot:TRINITY_DN2835_c0_g2_i1.p1 TRINITY_DN2835_c0_g2~~TRINITY_DN2835_c0_g2_i1.p1  ORF type:complete len:617 (+),score=173.36 TRINITY_DN2835_c0_g2_i1:49-1899(+)
MEEVPTKWNVDRVCLWLDGGGLGHLTPIFKRNKIDGSMLMSLSKTDLRDELDIDALSDRKALWDRLEALQRKKASPVPVPALSPKSGGGYRSVSPKADDNRCEECFKLFAISDVPILFKLPGALRSVQLHSHCKNTWARRNAKSCQQCHKPMITDITTITGQWGKAELHPECVRDFEKKQRDRAGPSAAPINLTTGGKGGRCEHCLAKFEPGDTPILLTLPGALRAAELHAHCKQAWARLHAKKCDQCGEAMTTDLTTLSGAFGKAEVHPSCVAAYEISLQNGARPASSSPQPTYPSHQVSPPPRVGPTRSSPTGVGAGAGIPVGGPHGKCEHCLRPFESYDKPILLTLPGASRHAELHPHCKTVWSRQHAKKCDFCGEAMITDITTLTGGWGVAELHPDCVSGYEKSKNIRRPSGGGPSGDRCDYCGVSFRDGETATVVTLPGENSSAKLHPSCRSNWSLQHAKKCEFCYKPMPTEVTTMSGNWGKADIHPECVTAFKDALATGRYPVKGSPPPHHSPNTSPPRTQRSASPNTCYHCHQPFSTQEAMTLLTVADLSHEVSLHDRCIDQFHRSLGHICTLCNGTVTGHMTKLSGDFGKATLHPSCLLDFKKIHNLV